MNVGVVGRRVVASLALLTACTAASSPDRAPTLVGSAPRTPPPSDVTMPLDCIEKPRPDDVELEEVEQTDALLDIPDRKQHPLSPKSGWCGETAIQEGLLHLGMWAPQRLVNKAGKPKHPDLYSEDIPVALASLGVRFAFYAAKTKGFSAYETWITDALVHGQPVLAGVKILPTEHPEWGLDHFILVVGHGPKGLLVNTTWDERQWVKDTTTPGLSFKDVYYGIRLLGLTLPKGAIPARLVVLEETATDVKVKLTCAGLTLGAPVHIEQREHAGDEKPVWSETVVPTSSVVEHETTIDAGTQARFHCVQ